MKAEPQRWHQIIPLWALFHPLNIQETAQTLQQGIRAGAMMHTTYFVSINQLLVNWQRLTSGRKYISNQAIKSDENT